VLEIQDGSQITGSTNISETMTYIIKIPTANQQEAYLGVSKDDRQLKMAVGTGNTYISETMKGTVIILTTNLWFKTLQRWKIVLTSAYQGRRRFGQKYLTCRCYFDAISCITISGFVNHVAISGCH